MSGSGIRFDNVSKRFSAGSGEVLALDGVSLDIRPGELMTVVGPSGCGKSTLLDLVAGLTEPSGGELTINGSPVRGPGLDRGVVFQQYALLPWRTAQGNVEFGLEAKGVPRRDRAELARGYLELVGLDGFAKRYPHELSGGMKQRVAIARSLAFDPEVLLMDEPFAALDEQTRMTMGDELLRIWAATGKTVVFVTHSLTEAVYLADEVIVMSPRPGRIVDHLQVSLPRPRTYEMLSGDAFGTLRDRIWRHIRKSA